MVTSSVLPSLFLPGVPPDDCGFRLLTRFSYPLPPASQYTRMTAAVFGPAFLLWRFVFNCRGILGWAEVSSLVRCTVLIVSSILWHHRPQFWTWKGLWGSTEGALPLRKQSTAMCRTMVFWSAMDQNLTIELWDFVTRKPHSHPRPNSVPCREHKCPLCTS